MRRRKPPLIPNKQSKYFFSLIFFLLFKKKKNSYLLIYVCGRAERVLEGSGISVAPPSRRSGRLHPASPKQQPSPASRQRRDTEEDGPVSEEDEASPKSRSCSPDVRSRHQDGKSSSIHKKTSTSRGRPGSRTQPSNDEGIFIIFIKYFMYICVNKHSLVDRNSVSRGRQMERGTPVVNPQVSTFSLRQGDQGIVIELVIFLVLIYIRCFDG